MQIKRRLAAPDDRRGRRLPAHQGAQALRAGVDRRDPVHQGDGQVAVPARRSRPLAARRHGAAARRGPGRAAADRRRQPRSAAAVGAGREPRRPRHPARGQRERLSALPEGRGDRRRHPLPRPRRPRQRRQRRGRLAGADALRRRARALLRARSGTARRQRQSARTCRRAADVEAQESCAWPCVPRAPARSNCCSRC